jgi:hypothetical protein
MTTLSPASVGVFAAVVSTEVAAGPAAGRFISPTGGFSRGAAQALSAAAVNRIISVRFVFMLPLFIKIWISLPSRKRCS